MRNLAVCLAVHVCTWALLLPAVAVSSEPVSEVSFPSKLAPSELVRRVAAIFSRHSVQVRYASESLGIVTGEIVLVGPSALGRITVHVSTDLDTVRVQFWKSFQVTQIPIDLDPSEIDPLLQELRSLASTPAEPGH